MRPTSAENSSAWPPASSATRRLNMRWTCWGCVMAEPGLSQGQEGSLGASEEIADGGIEGQRHQIGEDRRLGIECGTADYGGEHPAQRHRAGRDHREAPPDDEEGLAGEQSALRQRDGMDQQQDKRADAE